VVGAGVVPGFLSDLLPLLLTGVCAEVNAIEVRRRSDFSKWGQDVMTRYGFGLAPAEFERQTREGRVVLFKNLWQSVHMLADELRWDIGGSEELKQPHVSARPRRGDHMRIDAGTVGGFIHTVETRCAGDRRMPHPGRGLHRATRAGGGARAGDSLDRATPHLPHCRRWPAARRGRHGEHFSHDGQHPGIPASRLPGLKSVADLSPIVCRD
jgi:hypothetical protein